MLIHAPAKLNLCLFLGRRRDDGLHRIVSMLQPLDQRDEIEISPLQGADGDLVEFELVGSALGASAQSVADLGSASSVHAALAGARAAGWDVPECHVRVHKRIPAGSGLGGASADAGAVLRWIGARCDGSAPLEQVAMRVGADVPSQLHPRTCLVGGAGERIEALGPLPRHAFVLLTGGGGLETGAVYAEADRLGLGRPDDELDRIEALLREHPLQGLAGSSPTNDPEPALTNDLEPAALSLRPELAAAFEALEAAGAERVAMTGSGATVFGTFRDLAEAEAAAAELGRDDALVCQASSGQEAEQVGR